VSSYAKRSLHGSRLRTTSSIFLRRLRVAEALAFTAGNGPWQLFFDSVGADPFPWVAGSSSGRAELLCNSGRRLGSRSRLIH